MRKDFAVFILSHNRADNMLTVGTLNKCGYTGKWYIILDNEDSSVDRYVQKFGKEHIVIFDKLEASKYSDVMDNQTKRNIVLFARNECHKIAKDLGLNYFLVLDDDYTEFRKRYLKDGVFKSKYVRNLDLIIEETLRFFIESDALTVAFAQTGDFLGGEKSTVYKKKLCRKAMNSFFCRTDKPFKFIGRINEDVNMYCTLGMRGEKIFTVCDVGLDQLQTQKNKGGLTDTYLENGTYVKSFYSVMCCPAFVKVADMGESHKRLHHLVNWEKAVPKIISSRFKIV